MTTLYRFTVEVTGNLSETEAEQLDAQIDNVRLVSALYAAIERELAQTTFTDKSQYDLNVKVEA